MNSFDADQHRDIAPMRGCLIGLLIMAPIYLAILWLVWVALR